MRLSVEGQRSSAGHGAPRRAPVGSSHDLHPACRNSPGFLRPGLPPAPASPILLAVLLGPSFCSGYVSFADLTTHPCVHLRRHDCCHPVLTCPLCSQQVASGATSLPSAWSPQHGASPSQGPSPLLSLLAFLTPTPTSEMQVPPDTHPPQKCRCPALAFHPVRDYFYNFLLSQPSLPTLGG